MDEKSLVPCRLPWLSTVFVPLTLLLVARLPEKVYVMPCEEEDGKREGRPYFSLTGGKFSMAKPERQVTWMLRSHAKKKIQFPTSVPKNCFIRA